ncbi:MAG TPA: hypothetical protein VGD43_17925 [Micromonospora sp.]
MDSRAEIRDFLATRRAMVTPEQTGLPNCGGHRRVSGLRREEVALLAGAAWPPRQLWLSIQVSI